MILLKGQPFAYTNQTIAETFYQLVIKMNKIKLFLAKIDANQYYKLAAKEHKQSHIDIAIKQCVRAIEKYENHLPSLTLLSSMYYENEMWDKALPIFNAN